MVNRVIKIMIGIIVGLVSLFVILEYANSGGDRETKMGEYIAAARAKTKNFTMLSNRETDYWLNDSLYVWDDRKVNWVTAGVYDENQLPANLQSSGDISLKEPVKIKWEALMNIGYRLKYFNTIQTDMFAPVFGEGTKALHGKEVIVEGFVIPFDEEGELVALSYNPYSSCFFCGNASPASVISMYMNDREASYRLDDFKKFKGTLFLNQNNPDEFYYILKNVEEL